MSHSDHDRKFLFVVLDTVRKNRLSPYGHEENVTPRLNEYADDATIFSEAISQAPWTLPAHASMFTGHYPREHNATENKPYVEPTECLLGKKLSSNQISTASFSANPWISPHTNLTEGFDVQENYVDHFINIVPFEPLESIAGYIWRKLQTSPTIARPITKLVQGTYYLLSSGSTEPDPFQHESKTPDVINSTIEFLEETSGDYFAFLNLMDAHHPLLPPEKYRERFAPNVDLREKYLNPDRYNLGVASMSEQEWDEVLRLYDASLAYMDAQLGRVFDWLHENDEYSQTTIIVCSDHGELFGEFDFWGHTIGLYDNLMNIPFMIKSPMDVPVSTDEQIELVDTYDTVLDFYDIGQRPHSRGTSLFREDYTKSSSDFAFAEQGFQIRTLQRLEEKKSKIKANIGIPTQFRNRAIAVRYNGRKFIHNSELDDEYLVCDESGDRPVDVDDCDSNKFEDLKKILRTKYDSEEKFSMDQGDESVEELDQEMREHLKGLGYID